MPWHNSGRHPSFCIAAKVNRCEVKFIMSKIPCLKADFKCLKDVILPIIRFPSSVSAADNVPRVMTKVVTRFLNWNLYHGDISTNRGIKIYSWRGVANILRLLLAWQDWTHRQTYAAHIGWNDATILFIHHRTPETKIKSRKHSKPRSLTIIANSLVMLRNGWNGAILVYLYVVANLHELCVGLTDGAQHLLRIYPACTPPASKLLLVDIVLTCCVHDLRPPSFVVVDDHRRSVVQLSKLDLIEEVAFSSSDQSDPRLVLRYFVLVRDAPGAPQVRVEPWVLDVDQPPHHIFLLGVVTKLADRAVFRGVVAATVWVERNHGFRPLRGLRFMLPCLIRPDGAWPVVPKHRVGVVETGQTGKNEVRRDRLILAVLFGPRRFASAPAGLRAPLAGVKEEQDQSRACTSSQTRAKINASHDFSGYSKSQPTVATRFCRSENNKILTALFGNRKKLIFMESDVNHTKNCQTKTYHIFQAATSRWIQRFAGKRV